MVSSSKYLIPLVISRFLQNKTMKTIRLILAIAVVSVFKTADAQVLKAEKCTITFYSKTAMEDIDATNKSAICLLNTAKADVVIKAAQSLFVFKSAFMQ